MSLCPPGEQLDARGLRPALRGTALCRGLATWLQCPEAKIRSLFKVSTGGTAPAVPLFLHLSPDKEPTEQGPRASGQVW